MSEKVKTIEWYEARHIQLARRIACYKHNIKSLQKAYDLQQRIARDALNTRNAFVNSYHELSNKYTTLTKQMPSSRLGKWLLKYL